MKRNKKAERRVRWREGDRKQETERQEERDQKQKKRRETVMKTEVGLGWGEGRELQTQREGQSEMGPDPMRKLHWGPWRKSLSQRLISCLVLGGRGAGWVAGPSVPI